jgi:hypothetical protein
MKKVIAILFVAFAALFVVPYQIVVGVAAVLVAIALWKGSFDSDPDATSTSSGTTMNIGQPNAPLEIGRIDRLPEAKLMPASMTKFRCDDDLSIK